MIKGPQFSDEDESMCWAGRIGVAAAFGLLLGFGGWFLALPLFGELVARPWTWSVAQAVAAGLALPPASALYDAPAFAASLLGCGAGAAAFSLLAPQMPFDHVWAAIITTLAGDLLMRSIQGPESQARIRSLFCCFRHRGRTSH